MADVKEMRIFCAEQIEVIVEMNPWRSLKNFWIKMILEKS